VVTVCPHARFDPLGRQTQPRMSAHDIVCVHTMAAPFDSVNTGFHKNGYGGLESHFGVRGDEFARQWQDLDFTADANFEGNGHVISIETADMGEHFHVWHGTNVPVWTPEQIDKLVAIIAWCCDRFDIPPVLVPNSRPGNRGIAYHRQGIDGNFPPEPSIFAGRVSDGERWSESFGKACPGDRRIKQFVELVVPRVRAQVEGDDMGLLFESRAEFREEVLAALGGRTAGEPNLTANDIRPTLMFMFGLDQRMANIEGPATASPEQRGWDFADKVMALDRRKPPVTRPGRGRPVPRGGTGEPEPPPLT
jgi:hypothetical protein